MDAAAEIREDFDRLTEGERRQFWRWFADPSTRPAPTVSASLSRMREVAAQLDSQARRELRLWLQLRECETLMAQFHGAEMWIYTPFELFGGADELAKLWETPGAEP